MMYESEDTGENKKETSQHKQNVRCPENSWVVCRSKKRPGLYYDFNTMTGQAIWRDADNIPHNHMDKLDISGKYDCHEPTEPPSNTAHCRHQNVTQSSMSPNIYTKQVINNQFPAKPLQLASFGNAACAQYGLINSNNNIAMNATPTPVWLFPPPPFLGPPVAPLNAVQSIYETLQSIQMANTSVPLSNRFQVLNQLNNENPVESQQFIRNTSHTTPRTNPVRKGPNTPNDLRNLLRDRRKQDQQNNSQVSECPGATTNLVANVIKDERSPDDTDEWLEAHADNTGKKLNFNVECIWELAGSSASQECLYLVTSSKVLLNNIRFFSALASSDDRIRLLAPEEVMRGLRSATFSDKGRLAECAKRLLLTIRQNKDTSLKDASVPKFCSDLIEQNKHVVLLADEKDLHDQNTNKIPKFTVHELKQFLTRNSNRNDRTDAVSKMQIICDIKKSESLSKVPTPGTVPSPYPQEISRISNESMLKPDETSTGIDETEIKTSPNVSSGKRTANACVQTDFVFPVTQPEEIKSHAIDINKNAKDSTASKAPPRKIKLKRPCPSSNIASNERKTFKWRKRKDACSTPNLTPSLENSHKSSSYPSSLSNSTNDLTAQQNDNAVDVGFSDVSLNVKLIEETSTSGVISNSIDSESLFKVNKKTIRSESQANQKQDIIMYEVTSEFMNDRLKTRSDEWVPRFIQIMEEVLTEVLRLEPAFTNEPSPWDIQEATVCIKKKFQGQSVIVDAADKLAGFLSKIKRNKGYLKTNLNSKKFMEIFSNGVNLIEVLKTNLNSKEFMEMFSYGVNLIEVLQLELPNCEDLKIASTSLIELLNDIKEPNLNETELNESETFNGDFPFNHSANVSETLTSMSTDLAENAVPDNKELTRHEEQPISSNKSAARYSLRSTRSAKIQKVRRDEKKEENKSEAPCSNNKDEYSLFSSLGLQRNTFKNISITKTILNVPEEQQQLTPIIEEVQVLAPDIIKSVRESNEVKTGEQKMIRNFTVCPEIEMKLKSANNTSVDFGQEHAEYDQLTADDFDDSIDFTEDDNVESEHFIDKNNYNLIQTAMDIEPRCESTQSGDLDSNSIFKWVVHRTTYDYNSCLVKLRRFCQKTHEDLKTEDLWSRDYKRFLMEKTIQASVQANKMHDCLKCILNRDPSVTRSKFRDLFKLFGVNEGMSDTQLAEYRLIIEKYSKHADLLIRFVTLLADHVKDK